MSCKYFLCSYSESYLMGTSQYHKESIPYTWQVSLQCRFLNMGKIGTSFEKISPGCLFIRLCPLKAGSAVLTYVWNVFVWICWRIGELNIELWWWSNLPFRWILWTHSTDNQCLAASLPSQTALVLQSHKYTGDNDICVTANCVKTLSHLNKIRLQPLYSWINLTNIPILFIIIYPYKIVTCHNRACEVSKCLFARTTRSISAGQKSCIAVNTGFLTCYRLFYDITTRDVSYINKI